MKHRTIIIYTPGYMYKYSRIHYIVYIYQTQ